LVETLIPVPASSAATRSSMLGASFCFGVIASSCWGSARGQTWPASGKKCPVDERVESADLRPLLAAPRARASAGADGRAVRRIAEQRPETLETIRRNGFAFTDIGTEPGNWQHLAFSLYTTICEIDLLARAALGMRVGE
jgi:hypothetical protein